MYITGSTIFDNTWTRLLLLGVVSEVRGEIVCIDSPVKLVHPGSTVSQRCSVAERKHGCTPTVSSHCPVTCNSCSTYKCVDSIAQVNYNLPTDKLLMDCSMMMGIPENEIENTCAIDDVFKTCRGTCGYCESPAPSLAPSEPWVDIVEINFDENEFDLDQGDWTFDDYDYDCIYNEDDDCLSDYSAFNYFHPSIVMTNWGFYPGHLSPGSGFEFGVVTPKNVSFNQYGDTATMKCPGGSFYIESLWLNSAWSPNTPVHFYGITNNEDLVDFIYTVPSTTTPVFLRDEFIDFTDLIYFAIETPRDGDIAVLDDIIIGIIEECEVPIEHVQNHYSDLPPLNYSPLFPRHHW